MLNEWLDSGAFCQMSLAEKAAVRWLIGRMPERNSAIEVGSNCGGFTRLLDSRFQNVYSLDLDHSRMRLGDFGNTQFVDGDSKDTLPVILETDRFVNLVLIDADHSHQAVLADINAVLQYRPHQGPLFLLMHDSWMASVRQAIDDADWAANPHVQEVEKDFCVGDLAPQGFVGGLALAVLGLEERQGDLVIRQSHDYFYRRCLEALRR